MAPAEKKPVIGITDNTLIPSGTNTNATAATNIPPPNAMEVRLISVFTNPLWKRLSKNWANRPQRSIVPPDNAEYRIIWGK